MLSDRLDLWYFTQLSESNRTQNRILS